MFRHWYFFHECVVLFKKFSTHTVNTVKCSRQYCCFRNFKSSKTSENSYLMDYALCTCCDLCRFVWSNAEECRVRRSSNIVSVAFVIKEKHFSWPDDPPNKQTICKNETILVFFLLYLLLVWFKCRCTAPWENLVELRERHVRELWASLRINLWSTI